MEDFDIISDNSISNVARNVFDLRQFAMDIAMDIELFIYRE